MSIKEDFRLVNLSPIVITMKRILGVEFVLRAKESKTVKWNLPIFEWNLMSVLGPLIYEVIHSSVQTNDLSVEGVLFRPRSA
jgi:hypothetical protein